MTARSVVGNPNERCNALAAVIAPINHGNLRGNMTQPMNELQKRHMRRLNGTQMPFARASGPAAISKPNNDRDMLAPFAAKLPRRFKRGTSGSRLAPAKRAMVELRKAGRAAFFAGL